MSVMGERQVTGGNGRDLSGQEGLIRIWEVFGPLITVGS
jgi:hypothetical protein